MSWFRDAFEKVKEKGAAVKGIAKEVSHKAKEVKSRLIGSVTAAELEVQLESRAGGICSLPEMVDILRGWSSNITSADSGPRFIDDDRQLSFVQVMLRSHAVEELLALIVCHPFFRAEIHRCWPTVRDDDIVKEGNLSDSQLASIHLFSFLSKVFRENDKVWHPLVLILLSPHGLDNENLFDDDRKSSWVARCERGKFRFLELSVIAGLKKDWYDDWLEKERRDLAAAVDTKRNQIIQSGVGYDQIWQRIKLSGDLVDLYESVRDNLDDCAMHRASRRKAFSELLSAKQTEADSQIETAVSEKMQSRERQDIVHSNLNSIEDQFKPRLEAILEERTAIDFKISSLEETKRKLKLELERVSQELVDVQAAQRDAMKYESNLRSELVASRSKLNEVFIKEQDCEKACDLDAQISGQIVCVLENLRTRSDEAFQKSSDEIGDVYTQFDSAFVEAVQDHMVVLAESIQELFRRSKRYSDELESVKRNRNAQSVSSMLHSSLKENEKEEFSASQERMDVKVNELLGRLGEQATQTSEFNNMFREFYKRFEAKLSSNRLLKGEVEKITVVFAETEKILKKYVAEVPAMPHHATALLVEEGGGACD